MDEAEWLACDDPRKMLEFVRGKTSERKMRLFAAACCRRRLWMSDHLWPTQTDGESVLAVSERYADGTASLEELRAATDVARTVASGFYYQSIQDVVDAVVTALELQPSASPHLPTPVEAPSPDPGKAAREVFEQTAGTQQDFTELAALLRELLGNPIRPAIVSSGWLTEAVRSLAETVAATVDFTLLPILADALEDAGCTDAAILDHLRGPGPHVRGCFALDLVLGKS